MSKETTKRLGRGLSALISIPEPSPTAQPDPLRVPATPDPEHAHPPTTVRVDQLRPNPYQPRQDMDPSQLKALAESIRSTGLLQPIVVRPHGAGVFEVIAGERRWRAAQMAGLGEVPVVIRQATDEQMLELALVENIFRENLNPIERAAGYRQYCNTFGLSADEVAQRLGEDRSTVANYLRLMDLPSDVKEWVAQGKLSMGHARCLLAIKSSSDLIHTAKTAIDRDLSVRALEQLVRDKVEARAAATRPAGAADSAKRPQIRSLEQAFAVALGTRVEILESRRKGTGRIVIHYAGLDDFDRVTQRLGVTPE
ncbi:MAG: ParB/RepB/Spo0J family partition protein [Planctomycetes bacterium]|nr:ParB/RepB/Spo0J family partition protein [Planctomycetota bacterium]